MKIILKKHETKMQTEINFYNYNWHKVNGKQI